MRAADKSDPALRRAIPGTRAAVIPVGAIEQHGPHLPVSTDSDIITEIGRRLCRRRGFLLLPTIQYGVSFEHAPLFNLSLRAGTLRRVLSEIVSSLAAGGIDTVFVINGHHGNDRPLRGLCGAKTPGVFVLSYWRFMSDDFDHAGPVETSLMLAISGHVSMSRARRGFIEPIMSTAQRRRLAARASRSFTSVAENGVWGDPRGATAERGERLLSEIVGNMEKAFSDCLAGTYRGGSGTGRHA